MNMRNPTVLLLLALVACGDDDPEASSTSGGTSGSETGSSTSSSSTDASTSGSSTTAPGSSSGTPMTSSGESSSSSGGDDGLLDVYDLEGDMLYPEGVAYDPTDKAFYVGSLGDGSLHRIDADGTQSLFAAAPRGEWATSGIAVDEANRRLWACAGQGDAEQQQVIWVYDLASGDLGETFVLGDIAEGADCNDVTVGPGSLAYVSDPPLGVVHRLEFGGTAEIWATDDRFAPKIAGLGLNGLAVTPDESALILAKFIMPTLFRISLDDPSDITEVELSGDSFTGGSPTSGADGIVFVGDALFVTFDAVVKRVDFNDDATTGVVSTLEVPDDGLSTAANAEESLFVVKSEVTTFVLGGRPELPFQILRVPL